jgi:hypothetical protein
MMATASQKIILKDFNDRFLRLQEKFYIPQSDDKYWDDLTTESMKLVSDFQSKDTAQNKLISDMVMLFMQSREEMI